MRAALRAGTLAAALFAASVAQAGRPCETKPPTVAAVQQSMTLALRTAEALDASGAQVVVLGRIGQDLSRWGQRWSHLGFAYRDGGRWFVVHKLNHCGSAQAALYRQGLGEFFLDDLHRHEAGFVVLAPAAAAALRPVLRDDTRAAALHDADYSMVAYPWAQRYQQSNQWAIETLAAAQLAPPVDRERAQAWLRVQGYAPAVLRIGPLTRLGARVGSANIAFDDHPNEKRFADRIETVTADSVFAWLEASGLGQPLQVIR